ncbi:MAG: cytochrome c oxidase assembly protein [Actinobacteria bacterium]|nr:cytochrome c oxidase assembly protein [Actinomycetota bacterium]
MPGFLTDWELDGTLGLIFSAMTLGIGVLYLIAAEIGRRRDRRGRRWPLVRTASFVGGLAVLLIATDSGIGVEADDHLTAHMVEHMLIWLAAAPLLVAGAPMRLALYAFGRRGRRRLSAMLHSAALVALTGPVLSTFVFSAVVVISHLPGVYDLTLEDEPAHVAEHAVYLLTACLVWAPLIGADPLPHRPRASARCLCVLACMVPMAAISIWMLAAGSPLYEPYEAALGASAAAADQRLAGAIMLAAALPALAIALWMPTWKLLTLSIDLTVKSKEGRPEWGR